jgi:hypothetical protein
VPKERTGAIPLLSYKYVVSRKCLIKHFTFPTVKLIYNLNTSCSPWPEKSETLSALLLNLALEYIIRKVQAGTGM